jgi:hypothetical protein
LEAAVRLGRRRLVGPLLVAGADAKKVFRGEATAIALCYMLGDADSVRALIKKWHDAKERFLNFWRIPPTPTIMRMSAAHVCAASLTELGQGPQLQCLRALVQEGGADIDARDERGCTPLYLSLIHI